MGHVLQHFGLGVVVAVVVAVLAGWSVHAALRATVAADQAVVDSAAFVAAIDGLFLTVVQAENRVRGFVISGDSSYLMTYERALARFDAELALLRQRPAAAEHAEAIDTIATTFERWQREQADVMIAARQRSPGVLSDEAGRAYGAWLRVLIHHALVAQDPVDPAVRFGTWLERVAVLEDAIRSVLATPLEAEGREVWSALATDVQAYRQAFADLDADAAVAFADAARIEGVLELSRRFEEAWSDSETVDDVLAELLVAGVGGELVPTIRDTVDDVRAAERNELADLSAAAGTSKARAGVLAWAAPLAAVLLSSAVVIAFIAQLGRHVVRLGDATRELATGVDVKPIGAAGPEALRSFTRDFDRMAERVRTRDREAGLLAELAAMAHASRSIDEALPVIASLLPKMLPGEAGALWLAGAAREGLERAAHWGVEGLPEHVDLDDCWALRQGKAYRAIGPTAVRCAHDTPHAGATICVPLLSRDETLGVLSVRSDATTTDDQLERLVRAVAEQVALAIANLRLRDTLEQESIRDALTGLYNRRFLEHSLTLEAARAARTGGPISLLMVDVDHFKRYNDSHGHVAGDAVLRAVGRVLEEGVRDGDVACRYGGEEFALVLPGADAHVALQRAEALRRAIAESEFEHRGGRLPSITVSIGVATAAGDPTTPAHLVQRADEALYAAKADGRDRVRVAAPAGGTSPPPDGATRPPPDGPPGGQST